MSLDYNNSFLGEYGCSSLALDRDERRDEKKRLDHLKQDQTMLVIKRFRERKKVYHNGHAGWSSALRSHIYLGDVDELETELEELERAELVEQLIPPTITAMLLWCILIRCTLVWFELFTSGLQQLNHRNKEASGRITWNDDDDVLDVFGLDSSIDEMYGRFKN
ncbi:hypothetical protein Tco_1352501 [Tanacetum coccineum]